MRNLYEGGVVYSFIIYADNRDWFIAYESFYAYMGDDCGYNVDN